MNNSVESSMSKEEIRNTNLVIIYTRFGPYHIARLNAASDFLSKKGYNVIGMEVCPDDKFYAWNKVDQTKGARRVAVLPGQQYHEIPRKHIVTSVIDALNRVDPQIVVLPGWYYPEAIAGLRWSRKRKRTPILMSESNKHDSKRIWIKEAVKKFRIAQYRAALVGGRLHAEYLISLGMRPEEIHYGHNIVDNAHFRTSAADARSNAATYQRDLGLPKNYILAMGRFVPQKNFSGLLRAYRSYFNRIGDSAWSLVLGGDGELGSEIRQLIIDLNLETQVVLPGFIQYEDLPIYYGLASAFILPSIVEPWGLVVNEAMASGVPVLVSDRCGCVSELVEHGVNGYIFDPFNTEEMAYRLLNLHDHQSTLDEMGKASQRIISNWGPERFATGLWQSICVALDKPQQNLSDRSIHGT